MRLSNIHDFSDEQAHDVPNLYTGPPNKKKAPQSNASSLCYSIPGSIDGIYQALFKMVRLLRSTNNWLQKEQSKEQHIPNIKTRTSHLSYPSRYRHTIKR